MSIGTLPKSTECTDIFGKIWRGEKPDTILFRSAGQGVMVLLAGQQATEGHSVVVPAECAPKTALLSIESQCILGLAVAATQNWLEAAFPSEYAGAWIAGRQVSHAHTNIAPCYGNRDWLKVIGADNPQPFPEISQNRQDEIIAAATFHPDYAAAIEAQLRGENILPITLREMAFDLATPISPRAA